MSVTAFFDDFVSVSKLASSANSKVNVHLVVNVFVYVYFVWPTFISIVMNNLNAL